MNIKPGLVIIGNGPAGVYAAKAFREQDTLTPVTIITDESVHCYSRPRLPEVVAGKVKAEKISIHPESWYQDQALKVLFHEQVNAIDPQAHQLRTRSGLTQDYAQLVLAMGAQARFPAIDGLPSSRVHALRTLEDARRLKKEAAFKQHVILIGGGLLGLEVGHALTQLGLKVIVIEIAPHLLPRQLDGEAAGLLQDKLIAMGFEFFLGTSVARVFAQDETIGLKLKNGMELKADLAVVSAGISPRVALAEQAGLAVGPKGVIVDDYLRTSVPSIYAVGDMAQWRGTNLGLWSAAMAMGRRAGLNAAGQEEEFAGVVPSTKLKVAGIDVFSQGNINPEGAHVIGRRHDGDQALIKLFIRNDCLAGCILVGYSTDALNYKKVIEKKLLISGHEQELLQRQPAFKNIPGFEAGRT